MLRIGRIQIILEPWVHAHPIRKEPVGGVFDAETVEMKFSIQIGSWEPFHMVEIMRQDDFESRFDVYFGGVRKRVMTIINAAKEDRLEIKDGKLLIDGKEIGRW